MASVHEVSSCFLCCHGKLVSVSLYRDTWQDTGKNSNQSRSLSGHILSVEFSMWAHGPVSERGKRESPGSIVYSWGVGGVIHMQQSSDQRCCDWKCQTNLQISQGAFTHRHARAHTQTHTHSDAIVWNNEVVWTQMGHQTFVSWPVRGNCRVSGEWAN